VFGTEPLTSAAEPSASPYDDAAAAPTAPPNASVTTMVRVPAKSKP
jgi:hypothetical protein